MCILALRFVQIRSCPVVGDDQQYGSSANCDIQALQALSKRIHYGKFVAEAKFQERPEHYKHLIRTGLFHMRISFFSTNPTHNHYTGQIDEIRRSLTDKAVEERLLQRVYKKASTYGQDIDSLYEYSQNLIYCSPTNLLLPFLSDGCCYV